jgi:cellulase (glycosyl hydrolase family 5)/fibronectin type III domain protein
VVKRSACIALALAFAGVAALGSASPSQAASLSLSVSGNHLVDGNGATIQFHGVNRSGTEYGCVQGWGIFDGPSDAASVQAIAAWHVNVVRVLLNEDCWLGINGIAAAYAGTNYQQAIADYVNLIHQNGMYVELSLQWEAAGTAMALDQEPILDEDHGPAFWTSVANTFKNDPATFFGLESEPHDITWPCWLNGHASCNGQVSYTAAGMQEAVNAVRATGATNVISVSGIDYANNLSQWLTYEPQDPLHQLVAEAHIYGLNTCSTVSCFNSQLLPVAQVVPMIWGEAGETYDASECGSSIVSVNFPWAIAHTSGVQAWTWDTWGNCSSLISDYNGTVYPIGYAQWVKAYYATLGTITPTAPGPPLNVAALGGEASATVNWSAPASAGTSPISGYTIVSTPGSVTVTVGAQARSATVTGLTDGTAYTFITTASNLVGSGTPSAPSNAVTPGRGQYHALAPARVLDTRSGLGAPAARVGPGGKLDVQITGKGGVPGSGVAAVVLNATATDTTAGSYLTVWPAGVPQPVASNLNWTPGRTVANLVEVAVGVNGKVSLVNAAGSTNVVFDVAGYVATATATPGADGLYTPVVPNRVLDTRDGTGGGPLAPVGPGQTIKVRVAGTSGIPSTGVAAVVLNVTATGATAPSYLTAWPTGVTRPVASNLNFVAGQTVPNRVIVQLGSDGSTGGWVSFYNAAGSVNVIADVAGWFSDSSNASATGSLFVGVAPARILDTRNGTGGFSSALGAGQTIAVTVAGQGGVPAMNAVIAPSAVVLNVTVTGTTAAGYLTVWPDLASRPTASDLNWAAGQTVPNLVVVKLGGDGKIDLYNPAGSANVIVDVVGWFG